MMSRAWNAGALGPVLAVLTVLAGCGTGTDGAAPERKPSKSHRVVYQLESVEPAAQAIFYIDQTGEQQRLDTATLPWSKSLYVDDAKVRYLRVSVSVEPPPFGTALPTVLCRLLVDDKVVKESREILSVECATNLPIED